MPWAPPEVDAKPEAANAWEPPEVSAPSKPSTPASESLWQARTNRIASDNTTTPLPTPGLAGQIYESLPTLKSVFSKQALQDIQRPLPWITPIAEKPVKPTDTILQSAAKEAYNLGVSIPNFFATPAGAASALTGGAGGAIAKTIASGFSAQAWQNVGNELLRLIPNWHNLTKAEKTKSLVDIGGNTALGTLMAKGAKTGEISKPTPKPRPTIPGSTLPTPAGAPRPSDIQGPPWAEPLEQMPTAAPSRGIPTLDVAEPPVFDQRTLDKAGFPRDVEHLKQIFPKLKLTDDQWNQFLGEARINARKKTGQPSTTGAPNASRKPSTTRIPSQQIRSGMDETPPLQQQGETAPVQAQQLPEAQAQKPDVVQLPKKPPQTKLNPVKKHEFEQWARTKTVSELRQLRDDHEQDPTANSDDAIDSINKVIKEKSESLSVGVQKPDVKLTPDDLEPALMVNGKPVTGGANHREIAMNMVNANHPDAEAALDALDPKNDHLHVFVDKNGNVYDRAAAGKALGLNEPLQSEKLTQLKASAKPPKPEPPSPTQPKPKLGPEMGGALFGGETATPSAKTPTGIRNVIVDQERAKRGLPPAIQPARRSFGEVWDKAMAHIDRDPDWSDRLIDELRDKPRALTDEEDAALLYRQIDLQNEYGKLTRDLAQAHDDAAEFPERQGQVDELRVRTAGLSDKLLDLYNIGKRSGTETARGLSARRMMAYEDFSLAKMELDKRAANGGRPLTENERLQIQQLHDRIAKLEKQYDDYVQRYNQQQSDAAVKEAVARVQSEAKSQPVVEPHVRLIADKIKGYFDARANAALKRLTGSVFSVSPQVLADLTDLGVSRILSGAIKFTEWSADMVKLLGDRVKPHLQTVWESSQKALDDHIERVAGVNREKVKRATKQMDTSVQKSIFSKRIADKIAAGKRNEITNAVQRLARVFVEDGVKDRNDLIDKVHGVLAGIDPSITRRETMDAISGYGDFRQLSKDEISVELRSLKGQMQQVAKLEDMQAGKPPLKTGMERRAVGPEESKLIKQVNEAKRKFQIPISDPNTQLRSSLDELKKRMQTRIEDLSERLANRDFASKKQPPVQLDAAASKLKAELGRAKQKFMRGLIEDRMKNRPWWVKAQDTFLRWYRGGILSSPVVFAKLTAAAIVRTGLTPVEEAVGSVIGKVIPKIAARAPREGYMNSAAEAKAIMAQLTKAPQTAWNVLRNGEQDIDVLYGKGREGAIGEMQVRPFSVSDIPGRTHAALKAPTKQAEFERSLEKRLAYVIRNGGDASSPAVQLQASVEAYKDAQRAIFLQDNRVVSAYNRALRALEEPTKTTGKPPIGAKLVATAARTLVPIVRVPSNIVAEAIQFATGAVTGSARAGLAMKRGIENLPPEQADLIMRELKKGSIGAAALMAGFLLPQVWGGFYQRGEKRKPSDVKFSQLRIPGAQLPAILGGPDVPQGLLHHPIFEVAQAGATVRRIADKNQKEGGMAIPIGVEAAALGLIEETPFMREMVATGQAFDPNQRGYFFDELAKSITEPQLMQWLARQQDVDSQGQTVARRPKTLGQHLESGIPYLRQRVPVKPATAGRRMTSSTGSPYLSPLNRPLK